MGFHHIGQAGRELPTSGDPTALASQSAEITGMSHHTWPRVAFLSFFFFFFKEVGSHCIAQAGLGLLGSSDPFAPAA